MIDIGGGFRIVTRAEWGARPPACPVPTVAWSQRVGVAYHIQAGNRNTGPKGFQNYAMDSLGYCDSHYNYLVNFSLADQWGGNYIFELRGATKQGAHSSGENTAWIGVCTAGQNDDVTTEDLAALSALHAYLEQLGGMQLQFKGHQQLPGAQTSCPGATIMGWLAAGGPNQGGEDMPSNRDHQEALKAAGFYTGTVDGIWGPKSQAALTAAYKSVGPQGPQGAPGPTGPAGVTPKTVRIEVDAPVIE